jgi:hypothetical protein
VHHRKRFVSFYLILFLYFINAVQAAEAATPKRHPLSPARNLPSEIKRSITIKRTARSKWQTTHAPDDRRLLNNASNKLNSALHDLQNASFATYVSSLKRDYTSIWKPRQLMKKPRTPLPPIRRNSTTPGAWAKSDSEKVELFANHLVEVFTPHDNTLDPEVERELAAHI